MIRRSVVLVLVILLLLVMGKLALAQGPDTLVYDGLDRTFNVYVPSSYDAAQPAPLVIALHSSGSSGRSLEILSGLDAMAEEQGFIVAYPNSADVAWNDGRISNGWLPGVPETDDVGFINALIDHLEETYAVDPAHVYLVGHSTGGVMAYRLACQTPERFAKIAVVGAMPWNFITDSCTGDPVSLLMIWGAQDGIYPLDGRDIPKETPEDPDLRILSIEESLNFWSEHNGCDSAQTFEDTHSVIYSACENNTTLGLYEIEGSSNNWPRAGDYQLNQTEIDASRVVGTFFSDGDWQSLLAAEPETGPYIPRSYTVYVPPSYDPDQPTPVVIGLHGRPGTGSGFAYQFNGKALADENNVIFAYPDGLNHEWNYVRGTPGFEVYDVDDVEFLRQMVDDLAEDLNIDRDRLYVTGFSNGGFMTQRAACEAGDTFAAFAVIGASLFPGFEDICADQPPVPIMFIHGTEDTSIPWEGTSYGETVMSLSVPDTVIFWALHDGCDPDLTDYSVVPDTEGIPDLEVYRYTFGGCAEGTDVVFYAVEGGGHNIPGTPDRFEGEWAGQSTADINASREIWSFFEAHPHP
jgi:polyhydroxybutyrate depolymerase